MEISTMARVYKTRYRKRGRSRDSYDYSGRSYERSYDNQREYSGNRGYSGHDKEIDRFKMMMQDAVNQL